MYFTMLCHVNWHKHLRWEVQWDNYCLWWTGSLLLWTKSVVSLSRSVFVTHTISHAWGYNNSTALHTRNCMFHYLKISIANLRVCLEVCSKENTQILQDMKVKHVLYSAGQVSYLTLIKLSLAGIWSELLRCYCWKDLESYGCICLGTLSGLDV